MFGIRKVNKYRKGISLTEAAIGLVLMSLVGGSLAIIVNDNIQGDNARQAGLHMEQVAKAAAKYVSDNRAALLTAAENDADDIIRRNYSAFSSYLPTDFSGTNRYGQTYQLVLKAVDRAGKRYLESMLVARGGQAMSDRNLAEAAAAIGAAGGAVYAGDSGNIKGVGGGWSAPITDWSGTSAADGQIVDPAEKGRLVTYMEFLPEMVEANLMRPVAGMTPMNLVVCNWNWSGSGNDDSVLLASPSDDPIHICGSNGRTYRYHFRILALPDANP